MGREISSTGRMGTRVPSGARHEGLFRKEPFMVHPCSTAALFDLTKTQAAPLLSGTTFPWEALAGLETFIFQLGESLDPQQYERLGDYVWAAKTARIAKSAAANRAAAPYHSISS